MISVHSNEHTSEINALDLMFKTFSIKANDGFYLDMILFCVLSPDLIFLSFFSGICNDELNFARVLIGSHDLLEDRLHDIIQIDPMLPRVQ